jgi:uncharacterized protein YnzC (UPF0291/DUF896 family)
MNNDNSNTVLTKKEKQEQLNYEKELLASIPKNVLAEMEEYHKIREDKSITRYSLPDVETMKAIITQAENYNGGWYHSEVILDLQNNESDEALVLKQRIKELGSTAGIALLFRRRRSDRLKR